MVNVKLLIFSLISLIILIPIIYFLPLKLTKKGKLTVVAASFLIALAGLLTKVYMQLWQSILLLAGLILLLSLVLTKKFALMLFAVPENNGKEEEEQKEPFVPNAAQLETLSGIPTSALQSGQEQQAFRSNAVVGEESLELETLEELQVLEQNEVILPDASLTRDAVPEKETSFPLRKNEEQDALFSESAAAISENGVHDNVAELEEILFDSQTEVAAGVEAPPNEAGTEAEQLQESAVETEQLLDDREDLEALLSGSLSQEVEIKEEQEKEPSLDDTSDLEALLKPPLVEKEETETVVLHVELEDEVERTQDQEAGPVLDDTTDLEALLKAPLTEEAASIVTNEEQESDVEPVSVQEKEPVSDDSAELEALLDKSLIGEKEETTIVEEQVSEIEENDVESTGAVFADTISEELQAVAAEDETKNDMTVEKLEQVGFAEYPPFHEISIEELEKAVIDNLESMETEAVVEENDGEEVQTAVLNESKERELSLLEKNTEENHNAELFEEQWEQMDSLHDNGETAREPEVSEIPMIDPEEHKKESKHEKVFETLLLQAEIATKMQDEEQLKLIIKRFLNFDEVNDEHYNRLKILLKKYIDII